MGIRFGASGASDSFYNDKKQRSSVEMPQWLREQGLGAFEYQCGHGVRIGIETAEKLGFQAREYDIQLSLHAPYYINLCNNDPDKMAKTKDYFLSSLKAANAMNATTVVFHPGSAAKIDRREALAIAKKNFTAILNDVLKEGLSHITLAPETMGKRNQLGSLEEVLELCELSEQVKPAVDFGHIHAVTGGSLINKEAYAKILDLIKDRLGQEYLQNLHVHFSPIEFTAGGEKKHRTTLDVEIGPDFTFLAELLAERKLTPVIICESAGRQAEDAVVYRDIYSRFVV
ncbi:MAG: TIM barrel protein [Peptococcaceae bacterium]|nr:TIM barrel protein [Peptococcaceae bacterium]